jgi:guanylate cyclase
MTANNPVLQRLAEWRNRISSWGQEFDDDELLRLNKALMSGAAVLFIPAGLLWSAGYFWLGLTHAAWVPLIGTILLLVGLLYYVRTKDYETFRTYALVQTLLMPFALNWILGGFVNSGLVILWSALTPFASLVLENQRRALRWFLVFLILLVLSGWVQPSFPFQRPLPEMFLRLSFLMNLGSAFIITFVTAAYFTWQKETYRQRSESLLLNILPASVAARLKEKPGQIVDSYPSVSVLFVDIVEFTPLSAGVPPRDLVKMLNAVFSALDKITRKHGLEKIKTIGDAYMAASGVPLSRPDHARALALAALEMRDYLHTHTFAGRTLQFRFGAASGPVVAGVIGKEKFIYDLWGDTVNLASRLETYGQAGKIHISRELYELLKDEFLCERRGWVTLKGKGRVETFWLVGKR